MPLSFEQSLWRRIQNLRLATLYRTDLNFRKRCNLIFCLPFVNPNTLTATYLFVKVGFSSFPDQQKLTSFLDYFENTYLGETGLSTLGTPTYPPKYWSVYKSIKYSYSRSNNTVETLHSKFSKMIPAPHPNIVFSLKPCLILRKVTKSR
ncbi:hypothetical protein CDIK_0740 [Cucumispora dikerogammari]|nr:hypothetical protein CDIK_0740 [Cucumispora dikerogammari]